MGLDTAAPAACAARLSRNPLRHSRAAAGSSARRRRPGPRGWLCGLLLLTACREQASPGPAAPATTESEGPRELIQMLNAARQAGDYERIRSRCLPQRADQVVALLTAADEFLDANQKLVDAIRQRIGSAAARAVDQSALAGNLDIFSRSLAVLDVKRDGDEATVTFWADQQLPVRRARFQRLAGRWYYDPGPDFVPELPQALRRMAQGLRDARAEVLAGHHDAEAIRRDPTPLVLRVAEHLAPGVALLPSPPASQPAGGGP